MAPEGDSSGILGEFEEFLKAKRATAEQDDFAVNLSTEDDQGHTHRVEGIPVSQAAGFMHKVFGIGPAPDGDKGDSKGDDGKGDDGKGQAGNPLAYFQGGKRKSS
jgi:hypothetical protein